VVPSDAPHGYPLRGQGRSTAIYVRLAHAQTSPQPRMWRGKSPCDVAQRVSAATKFSASEVKGLHVAHVCRKRVGRQYGYVRVRTDD